MFTRIVKMHFKPKNVDDFVKHFNSIKEKIRNQAGCRSVILLQDKTDSTIFFTYSIWENESDLERYRKSEFFKQVWQQAKQLFDKKPKAWSVDEIANL